MAYASTVRVDVGSGTAEVLTSIVGLPPVFMFGGNGSIVVHHGRLDRALRDLRWPA